jgi:hypothetical protein
MKMHKLFATLAPAAVLAAAMLFCGPTASAQATVERRPGQRPAPVPAPVVTVNEKAFEAMPEAEFREILVKRLNALEAENKELKSQLFAAKLLLSGLDKGVGDFKAQFDDFKAQFAKHSHRIQATTGELVQVQNDSPKRPFLLYKTLDQMKSDKGFFTGPPVGQQ